MLLNRLPLMVATVLMAAGCTAPAAETHYTVEDFAKVRKFDAHVHLNVKDPAFVEQAKADNFELLTINVDYPAFPSIADQADAAHHFHKADPQHFHYAATFTMQGFGTPEWAGKTNAYIDSEADQGALGVKVWKNIGMVEKDKDGKLIFIDDAGFDPVIAHIEQRGLVFIAHQAEPKNAWLPVEEMTTTNDKLYFGNFPEYHMYKQPDMPRYEALIAARDRFVTKHPELNFVGAHMGSLEWNVDEAAKFLDAHPNATLELAARITQIQYQSVRDHEKVRNFFIKYQDRLMYGTDLTLNPGDDPAAFRATAHDYWRNDWAYLATDTVRRVDDIEADVTGLNLPKSVIDKLYYTNAKRVFFNQNKN